MPITPQNFQRAIQALAKAKANPNSDPAQIARIQSNIDQYLNESGQYGPPAPPTSETASDTSVTQPDFQGRGSVAGYFYNPSVEEFRSAMKERTTREKLGFGDTYQTDETVASDYLKNQVPELASLNKTNISGLTENSPEYKAYAEHAYQQALNKDPSIKRYDDLDIMQNPGQKALGALIKYGPAAVRGAEKNAGLGIPTALIKSQGLMPPINPATGQVIAPEITQTPESQAQRENVVRQFGQDIDTLESLSPKASAAGGIGSYALPFAPSNLAQKGLAELANYAGRGAIGKALTSGAIGGTVGAAEGAIQDVTQNPNITGQQLIENAGPRAFGGALLGAGGDLLAQGASRTQQVISESPRYRQLKNIRDVGGDTHTVWGVTAPDAVRENITNAAKSREQAYAADIAAEKVAPQILESNKSQIEAARKKSAGELEAYLNTPEITSQQESMQPVADNIFDMFNRGTFEGAISGDLKHPNSVAAKTFKNVLNTIGEVAYVAPEEAASFASANRGRVVDQKQMAALGIKPQDGKIPVYVASKMPARALLQMEQMIDDRLKMATTEGGANNPVWKEINRSVKQVRDRFGNPNRTPSVPPVANQSINPPDEPLPNYSVSPVPESNQSLATSPTGIQEDITNVPTDIRFGDNPLAPKISTPDGGQVSIAPEELSFSSVSPPDMTDSEWARFNQPQSETVLSSPNALPEYIPQEPGRPVNREPSASDYQAGTFGEGPRQRWEDTLPEANQSLNETGYGDYLKATKSDAARQQNFAQNMEGHYWKRPAEMSEKEIDKEVIAMLKGEGLDMNITPENRARVYSALESRGEQFAPYIARLKEIEAAQLAKQQAAKTGVPGEDRVSQYEELGSSAIIEEQPSIGLRSAEAAYTPSEIVSNQGNFTPSEVAREINQSGGVGAAGKLNRGMRDESLARESAKYIGKNKEEINQIAANLEYPIDVSIDNGNIMLRDGRHRLEAAKQAGAKTIKVRVRKFNAQGKAEEVTTKALPIDRISEVSSPVNESVSPVSGESVANASPDASKPVPTETLDDGTVVYGLSAVQRKHHKELERLAELEGLTGTNQQTAHKQVLNYKRGEGHPYNDRALAAEADKLGLRQQLEEVPATRDFPGLSAQANLRAGEGVINAAVDAFTMHADPVLGAIAGQPPNPFTAPPNTPAGRIQQYLFRQGVPFRPLLEGRAGLAGARFGNKFYNQEDEKK